MRVLITGIAGHLGSRLADYALREQPGTEVIGVDDLSCGYMENVPDGAQLIIGDAGNRRVIEEHGEFDAVFHLAAYAAECMSPFCRGYNYQNNLVTTGKLVSSLIESDFEGRLVYASSIAAYGDARGTAPPFDERMHCSPRDPYGVAKLAGEMDVEIAGEQHGLDWCIVRPHNVYGEYQSIWQRYRNVLGLWMRAVLEGRSITVYGDGEQQRAFSYVGDVLPALWRAGTSSLASGHVINIGGSQPTTINDLVATFCEVVDDVRIHWEPARHEVKHAWCTTKRSEELLQYRDATPLRDGIARMWEWARTAWAMYPDRRDAEDCFEIETQKKMPESWKRLLTRDKHLV